MLKPFKGNKLWRPRPWQLEALEALFAHRRLFLAIHRRGGKTALAAWLLCRHLGGVSRGTTALYLSPRLGQAVRMLVPMIFEMMGSRGMPMITFDKARGLIECAATGNRVILSGFESQAEYLRGLKLRLLIIDEIGAVKKAEELASVVLPALYDTPQNMMMVQGTPPSDFSGYEFMRGLFIERCYPILFYPVTLTGLIRDQELAELKALSPVAYRREFLLEYDYSAPESVLVPPLWHKRLQESYYNQIDVMDRYRLSPFADDFDRIMGIDIGGTVDSTICMIRQGVCFPIPSLEPQGTPAEIAADVVDYGLEHNVKWVNLDGSRANDTILESIEDALLQNGFTVSRVYFGGQASDNRKYRNVRCEMAFKLQRVLETQGAFINSDDAPELLRQGAAIGIVDSERFTLETKNVIRKRLGRSTDLLDAAMLTTHGCYLKETAYDEEIEIIQ